jgi:hypothetical protein
MWESKAESIDVNYNLKHVWFDGINGQHVQKPADIRKWEESKVYKLIEKNFPRVKADKMSTDLSSIAVEWAKNNVRQRQTFKLNIKGENVAPLAFQHDPDGTHHSLAVQLRNYELLSEFEPEETAPIIEPVDGEETDLGKTRTPAARTGRPLTPANAKAGGPRISRATHETPEAIAARQFDKQKEIISAWIEDEDHEATEECRHALELYAQLNDSEFSYVTDLQLIYDEARCFFLQ